MSARGRNAGQLELEASPGFAELTPHDQARALAQAEAPHRRTPKKTPRTRVKGKDKRAAGRKRRRS
jgi:hypothetical protein